MDKEYKVSIKGPDGKWRSHGNVKKNQWGNLSLGIRATPEVKALFANVQENSWVNFSLFEADSDRPRENSGGYGAPSSGNLLDDESVPF